MRHYLWLLLVPQLLWAVSTDYRSLESLLQVMHNLSKHYLIPGKVSETALLTAAIQGMAAGLDPHTVVLSPKDYRKLTGKAKGRVDGIGVYLIYRDNSLIINKILPGTPAAAVGLQTGDQITKINGKIVTDIETSLARISGPSGSPVHLEIVRDGKVILKSLRRAQVRVDSVSGFFLAKGIIYVRINIFQQGTPREVRNFLDGKKYHSMVLDLRANSGGLFQSAVQVADLFVSGGQIVSTKSRKGIERSFASKAGTLASVPMMILIDGGTASAAEIVAGALQGGQAVLLGERTFGKGSVQTLIPLSNGGALKFTVATYYTPRGEAIQARGITPDIEVPLRYRMVKKAKRIREVDLEGHLGEEGKRQVRGSSVDMKKWPLEYRGDEQLSSAFRYLLYGRHLFQAGRSSS